MIITASPVKLCLIIPVLALYFLYDKNILLNWFSAISKVLPLIIAILIFSLVSNSDFYSDLMLIARIITLLLLSVFLISTSSVTELFSFLPAKLSGVNQFLTATLLFIPVFMESFAQARKNNIRITNIFTEAIGLAHQEIDMIRQKILTSADVPNISYCWKSDMAGIAIIFICAFIMLSGQVL
jgi:hypothetical protein